MKTVSVREAKATFSKLLAAAERGEEVTIVRNGKPLARLAPVYAAVERTPGLIPGLKLDPTFWDALPEGDLTGF